MASAPKIILYTNHSCPWAHRAHIALKELGLEYQEEIIDLNVPRTPEYLKINPRGLVPTISYNGHLIPESGIVSQFLVDAHPSHLSPPTGSEEGALGRARIAFFVDAFFSKVHTHVYKLFSTKTDAESDAAGREFVSAVVKELEPLLENAAPFFGGSDKLTLAEVLTASFVIRVFGNSKHGAYPKTFTEGLPEQAPNFYKWAQAVIVHPSVTFIYDEKSIADRTAARIAKVRAG